MFTAIILLLLALRCAVHAFRPDFVAHSSVRWMNIVLGILGGFLGMVLLFNGGVALAGETAAPAVDLRPLWGYGVELAVTVAGVLGGWVIRRLTAWLNLHEDSRVRQYLDEALARALQYAMEVLLRRGENLAVVTVRDELVAIAASYAASAVPDALRRFNVDNQALERLLRARLPEIVPHPAQPLVPGTILSAP